jgi:GAF domain-containing protein
LLLPSTRGPESLCERFISALPVQHAAISTLGDPFELETVCSTDALAARLDELQLDFGEGPCWQARATRAAVLVPDLRTSPSTDAWPVLRAALGSHEIRSAYAFPLTVGSLDIGAVDLYGSDPGTMSPADIIEATALADHTAIEVLRRSMAHHDDPLGQGSSPRRVVHQATGMVIAQLRVDAEDAMMIIRAHAFATDRSVHDVSADILARRITFTA